jgi:hypothetical protein
MQKNKNILLIISIRIFVRIVFCEITGFKNISKRLILLAFRSISTEGRTGRLVLNSCLIAKRHGFIRLSFLFRWFVCQSVKHKKVM